MKTAAIIMFLIMVTPAMAQNSSITCYDSATLQEVLTVSLVNSSNTSQVYNTTAYVLDTACINGCDNTTNTCNPSPIEQNLIFLGGFIGGIFLLVFIWRFLA